MHKVKCKYCNIEFNADKVEFVMIGRRYAHASCQADRDKEIATLNNINVIDYSESKKKDLKKCKYCGGNLDIAREPFKNIYNGAQVRYAHEGCYNKYYSPDDEYVDKIYQFLKNGMNITYDYVQCERQRKSFISQYGYTNEGMLNALKYFYLVKKQSPEKSGNRIGIIPYVYNEAQSYYKHLEENQKKIEKIVNKQLKEEPIHINITKTEKRQTKKLIDIDEIGGI